MHIFLPLDQIIEVKSSYSLRVEDEKFKKEVDKKGCELFSCIIEFNPVNQ